MFGPYGREVFYYETDRMGIVHHSNYIRWFEEARGAYLEEIGAAYPQIEAMGILVPVLSVEAEYRLPFRYGDEYEIYLMPVKFNGVKAEFVYEVRKKGSDEIYTKGKSSHCFVKTDMKPFSMKREFPELYETLMKPLKDKTEE